MQEKVIATSEPMLSEDSTSVQQEWESVWGAMPWGEGRVKGAREVKGEGRGYPFKKQNPRKSPMFDLNDVKSNGDTLFTPPIF